MTNLSRVALAAVSTIALAASAQAATIDFGGLAGPNGTAFTGPYVEDGFTVTATAGQVFEGTVFGNPTPSLVVGSVFNGGNSGTVQITGSAFRLGSWDQTAQNGDGGYTVEGYLGATLLYTLSGPVAGTGAFQTFSGNAVTVDRLVFTLTASGTSTNFDNVVLNAVPEPAAWALMITGFGFVGAAARGTRARVRFA
jgi:hypothetical protein